MLIPPQFSQIDVLSPSLVKDAFDSYHRRPVEDTWGEIDLHSSDLAKCARQVWSRRNGRPQLPMPSHVQRKLRIGTELEEQVADALEFELSNSNVHFTRQSHVVGMRDGGKMVGHPDFVLMDGIGGLTPLEVKTMVFISRWVDGEKAYQYPKEPRRRDLIQLVANGLGLGAKWGRLYYVCRDSGLDQEWVLPMARFETRVRNLHAKFVQVTAPGAPEPVAEKPPSDIASYACRTCPHVGCEMNKNPMGNVI